MEMQKNVVLPVVLRGNNYLLWSRTANTALRSRGLWSYVEETVEENEKEAKWDQEDQQVLTMLQASLEPSILAAYVHCNTAKELWSQLKGVYGDTSSLSKVFELKKALNDLQQDGKTFKEHFGTFGSLWAELDMLRPSTMDQKILNERREQDQVFGLLLTLNNSYKDLIQHILRFEKLPSLTDVCAMIQKEEGSRSLFKTHSEMVHVAQRGHGYGERKTFWCEHCKKKGHTKERCWSLHPEMKPAHLKANGNGQTSKPFAGTAKTEKEEAVNKSDLEALFQSMMKMAGKNPLLRSMIGVVGKCFLACRNKKKIIIDSGASHHMISNRELLSSIKPHSGSVKVADGKEVDIEGIGSLRVLGREMEALYVPGLDSNLLSVNKATKDLSCDVVFGSNQVEFQDKETKKVFGVGGVHDGLYLMNKEKVEVGESFVANKVGSRSLWHSRLGHPSHKVLSMILPNQASSSKECEACVLGKQSRNVFPDSSTHYEEVFDLVHSDVWTAPCNSMDQSKYFVSFIDHKSRYTWLQLLRSKNEVYEAFVNLYNYVVTQYGKRIKILRSDNGGEYMSNEFKKFLKDKGMIHQTSCAYTPQQNGVSERKNRHLLEVARSMMFEKGLSKGYWGHAVETACYLINRLPTENLEKKSPYEILNGDKPSMDHLRVFGCKCFVFLPEMQRNKLEPKSSKCVFVGYSTTQKGWKCFHPETNRIYVSRDVKFDEEERCFAETQWEDLREIVFPSINQEEVFRNVEISGDDMSGDNDSEEIGEEPLRTSEPETPTHSLELSEDEEPECTSSQHEVSEPREGEDQSRQDQPQQEDNEVPQPVLRRSQRIKYHPDNWWNTRVYYNGSAIVQEENLNRDALTTMGEECTECTAGLDPDPIGNSVLIPFSSQSITKESTTEPSRDKKSIKYPIETFCSLDYLSKENKAFMVKIEGEQVPRTYEEACKDKRWIQAMEEEINSMEKNHTWDMIELPQGKKLVGCRWVFTIKYKSNGEIERYKARLVAKGYTQVYGEDYTETFAPVAKLHSIRVLLSIAVNLDWELWQMDVKNAFLQGDLEEEVFMAAPQGYGDETSKVCKLRKAIYGLKQSPRAWYHRLSGCLEEKDFERSEADHTLFTKRRREGLVVVLIYVDDIIITGDDVEGIKETKELLKSSFDIKDLGELKYFLGIEMAREDGGLFISQTKYTLDILKETGKIGAKPANTPIEEGYKDVKVDELWHDVKQYQRLVGKLIYLTITRPDICFAVNRVSQHMQTPKTHHWNMVERILRYLKGNPGRGIWLKRNGNTQVEGYCDADWAGDKHDRKSTTGYCTFVGGNLVTWRSKKQKVIALSSAEAEYRAMKEVTKEMVWLKALLKDLGVQVQEPMSLYCDNQAAIHIASNPVFHERTKHIEVDCHFVRGKIQEGLVEPRFVKSGEQMADIFTKAATSKVCEYVHSKIGLWDPMRPILRGSVKNTQHTLEASSHEEENRDRPRRPNGDQPRPKEVKPIKPTQTMVDMALEESKPIREKWKAQTDQEKTRNASTCILAEKSNLGQNVVREILADSSCPGQDFVRDFHGPQAGPRTDRVRETQSAALDQDTDRVGAGLTAAENMAEKGKDSHFLSPIQTYVTPNEERWSPTHI